MQPEGERPSGQDRRQGDLRRRGRPPILRDASHITFWAHGRDHTRLVVLAARHHMDVSAYARQLLSEALDRAEGQPEPPPRRTLDDVIHGAASQHDGTTGKVTL